jgi:UDP-N-acetylmuramate: L-alanyl-gamma-D-glutamyl-meso-diaminopimelate ligase
LLAWVLHHAGRDPGFLIGGLPHNFASSFRVGSGSAFVVEGDEYDSAFFDKGPKFMHYRPDTALIGTVEFDHADIYRDLGEVERVFRWLTNIVPRRGLIVRHEDCEVTRAVTAKALARVTGYGLASGAWRAVDLQDSPQGTAFHILREGTPWADIALRVSGEYNVRNALAVAAAAAEQGLTAREVARSRTSRSGSRRSPAGTSSAPYTSARTTSSPSASASGSRSWKTLRRSDQERGSSTAHTRRPGYRRRTACSVPAIAVG